MHHVPPRQETDEGHALAGRIKGFKRWS